MNTKKANEIIALNVLHLTNSGLDCLPLKLVFIESFQITGDENGKPQEATLIGILEEKSKHSSYFKCKSYFVQINNTTYYYRDFMFEAMELIQALRFVNNWKTPYPDESFSFCF
jgi:hypothetical protein